MTVYDSLKGTVTHWRHPSTLGIDRWSGLLVDTADVVYAMSWFQSAAVGREAYPGEREGYLVLGAEGSVRVSIMRPPSLGRPAVLVSRMTGGDKGERKDGVGDPHRPSLRTEREVLRRHFFGGAVEHVGVAAMRGKPGEDDEEADARTDVCGAAELATVPVVEGAT